MQSDSSALDLDFPLMRATAVLCYDPGQGECLLEAKGSLIAAPQGASLAFPLTAGRPCNEHRARAGTARPRT